MGFLDELKNKTEQQQAAEAAERARQEELDRIYRGTILPKLQYAYGYLQQLCEHLNYQKEERIVSYQLPGYGEWRGLRQQDYAVQADSRDNMQEVILSFGCQGEAKELEIHAKSKKEYDTLKDFYTTNRLTYSFKMIKDEYQEQIGGRFFIAQRVPVAVGLMADVPNSLVQLRIRNFPAFGLRTYSLQAAEITEAFMDSLAEHIVGRNPDFMRLDLAEDLREKLQQKLREEQILRQRELEEAERAAAEAQAEQARGASLLNKLKSGIKNIQKKI